MPAQNAMQSYAALCNNELWNVARLSAYVDAGIAPPGFQIMCKGCVGLEAILPCVDSDPPADGYLLPELDPAPWYDPKVPESKNFAGLLVTSVTMSGPYGRSMTENVTNGATLGRLRAKGRTMVVTGWLIGKTCCSVLHGLRWLTSALADPPCAGQGCDGCDFDFLDCCPSIGTREDDCITDLTDGSVYVRAPGLSEYQRATDFWRRMHKVGVIDGPNVLDCRGNSCGCCCGSLLQVEFTLGAGNPYLYSLAEPVATVTDVACLGAKPDCESAGPLTTRAATVQIGFNNATKTPPWQALSAGHRSLSWHAAKHTQFCSAEFDFNSPGVDQISYAWTVVSGGNESVITASQISAALGVAFSTAIPSGTSGTLTTPEGIEVTITVTGDAALYIPTNGYGLGYGNPGPHLVGDATVAMTFDPPLDWLELEQLNYRPGNFPQQGQISDVRLSTADKPNLVCGIKWTVCADGTSLDSLCPGPSDCRDDPQCPTPPLPPAPSNSIPLSQCACLPFFNNRVCVPIAASQDWFDSTLNIDITAGTKALRNVLIQIFQNPAGVACENFGECDACGTLFVSYIPKNGTLHISGEGRTVEVECNGVSSNAFRNVVDRNGQPFDWPDISCSDACVCITYDCDHYSEDAVITIERVDRVL